MCTSTDVHAYAGTDAYDSDYNGVDAIADASTGASTNVYGYADTGAFDSAYNNVDTSAHASIDATIVDAYAGKHASAYTARR